MAEKRQIWYAGEAQIIYVGTLPLIEWSLTSHTVSLDCTKIKVCSWGMLFGGSVISDTL